MFNKAHIIIIYLAALLLFASGCAKYYENTVKVGQCFSTRLYVVKIVEKRQYGAEVLVYEDSNLRERTGYIRYEEFDNWSATDCPRIP